MKAVLFLLFAIAIATLAAVVAHETDVPTAKYVWTPSQDGEIGYYVELKDVATQAIIWRGLVDKPEVRVELKWQQPVTLRAVPVKADYPNASDWGDTAAWTIPGWIEIEREGDGTILHMAPVPSDIQSKNDMTEPWTTIGRSETGTYTPTIGRFFRVRY